MDRKNFFDVIAVGGAAWDFLGIIGKNPEPGEKVGIIKMTEQGGGQAGTAVSTVARLGGKAAFVGVTGDDEYGVKIRKSLSDEGVDISNLFLDIGKTSHTAFCMVHEPSGDRTIYYNRGTKRYLEPEEIDMDFVRRCKCLLTDTHHIKAIVACAETAVKAGIPVVTDIEKHTPYNDELFTLGTHHILPARFLMEIMGENTLKKAMTSWRKKFKKGILVATLGDKGSIACNGNEIIKQEAYKPDRIVDTTGAGDVFHGAFAYGLTLGYDLRTNLRFASLISGLKCGALGGRTGIPTREKLEKYWNNKGF